MNKIPIIIASDFWLKVVTFGNSWVAGISLYPFVLIKEKYKNHRVLINHEKIHTKQQSELLVVFFYLWYLIEYLIRIIQYKEVRSAYRNISFEREAFSNEGNLKYLEHRKPFSFIQYCTL